MATTRRGYGEHHRQQTLQETDELVDLTQRQREVLTLLARQYSRKRIADELGISINTVNTHIKDCISLLNTSGWYAAVCEARTRGLIP